MLRTAWLTTIVVMALVLAGCAGSSGAKSPGAAGSASSRAVSLMSAERTLAAGGIATVADESNSSPLVRVVGPTGLRFTQFEVQTMAIQASDGGGVPGATLDAAAKSPATGPSASYLLAAWVSKATTPAAAAVRTLMGPQDWHHAPQVRFPTIALAMFASDVVAHLGTAPNATSTRTSIYVPSVSGVGGIEQVGVLDAPCSLVSNFMQGVLNSVFTALQGATPTSTGVAGRIGGFLVGLWNTALGLAQQGVQTLITAITGPILNAITAVAGTAVVIAQVASYLSPWSVKVNADPGSIDPGSSGTFTATVDSGPAGFNYPAAVQDCANKLSITLPPLTAANAKATWELNGQITATGDTSTTMDDQSSSALSFKAADSGPGSCNSASTTPAGEGTGTITVTRPGLNSLKQLGEAMLTTGLGAAGGIIGHAVLSLADPIISSALGQIDTILQITGAGTVVINAPASSPSCSPTPTPTATSNASGICGGGSWVQTGEHFAGSGELGGAGAQITITADGHMTEVYHNVTFTSGDVFNGHQTATITSCNAITPTSGTLATVTNSVNIAIRRSDGTPGSLPDLDGTKVDFNWTDVGGILTMNEPSPAGTMISTYKNTAN